ncbi:MAG: NERD domain-containing protein [Actinomycetia bacterium]|nr:NERD domain-containing protein [Actinomycetes bacterium]
MTSTATGAGASARAEARRQLALADAYADAAEKARQCAARYRVAATTEAQTAALLSPLTDLGHHLLADRGWPGSRRSQVDLVVIGPAGVFIVDTKAWAGLRVDQGRVFRGPDDVTDDLATLADLAEDTQVHLAAELGLAPGEVRAVAAMAGHRNLQVQVAGVTVVGQHDLLHHITGFGTRLTEAQVDALVETCQSFFPVTREPAPVVATIVPPAVAPPEQEELFSTEEILASLEEAALSAPIEDWMTYLHPTQARTVCRSFNGPARVRGPAGTGKTVVGLHRAPGWPGPGPGRCCSPRTCGRCRRCCTACWSGSPPMSPTGSSAGPSTAGHTTSCGSEASRSPSASSRPTAPSGRRCAAPGSRCSRSSTTRPTGGPRSAASSRGAASPPLRSTSPSPGPGGGSG